MNPALQQLKDIHLPAAINKWQIAPGWIVLSILVAALIVLALYSWYRLRVTRHTVKFAMAKLKNLQNLMQDNPDDINIAAEISTLMRRTALHYFRRDEIAGLAGADWLQFLNQTGKTTQFTQEQGLLLTDAPYQKNHSTDLTPLFTLAQAWLVTISKKKGMSAEK